MSVLESRSTERSHSFFFFFLIFQLCMSVLELSVSTESKESCSFAGYAKFKSEEKCAALCRLFNFRFEFRSYDMLIDV